MVYTDSIVVKETLLLTPLHLISLAFAKGVFNLSNQLSNFSKNWGVQRNKTEFYEFHGLTLTRFSYLCSKMAIIPTILVENIWHSLKLADIGLKKCKMTQNLLETNSTLNFLTFQLSNVGELETIKYAFGVCIDIHVSSM